MANKKVVATIAAVATSAALLMGGTMAWQSINQTALNEASEVVNPGGRLHDDFNGTNKDIYVENFADEPIFARIRLDEHFEIRIDDGDNNPTNDPVEIKTFTKDENGEPVSTTREDTDTYVTHLFHDATLNDTDPYWMWKTGGSTVYMPTFNMNKDSLRADANGTLQGNDGLYPWEADDAGNLSTDEYSDYKQYSLGEELEGQERHDRDSNDLEEFKEDDNGNYILDKYENPIPADGDSVNLIGATHSAADTLHALPIISMEEWETEYNSQPGPYWVYDTDGWAYWAAPIEPGTATGLLLDGIQLKQVMDDGWYYAINAVGQFITANDLGFGTGTGFYDESAGTPPTEKALNLLKIIGVDVNSIVSEVTDPDADPEEIRKAAAENLQSALNAGGIIELQSSITSNERHYPTDENGEALSFYADFTWSEGGTLKGGELNLNGKSYAGLFVNSEKGWPAANDAAEPATIESVTINSISTLAVYSQAIDNDVTLSHVNIKADNGGVYAEFGNGTTYLNNVTVDASNNWNESLNTHPWYNTAVAAANKANVVINNGYYEGKNAVYAFSSGANIKINNGTFVGDIVADAAKIEIFGGAFSGDLKTLNNANLSIYGGTFSVDPSDYVTEAYKVIPGNLDDEGNPTTWTVQVTEQP